MSDEKIRIDRAELFAPEVDQALAREHAGRERVVADTLPVSPVRRLLLNSLFHLPLAAVVMTLAVWLFLEPKIEEVPTVGGPPIRNQLAHIDRWKIIDNLRRSLTSPAALVLLVAGWTWLPGSPLAWT